MIVLIYRSKNKRYLNLNSNMSEQQNSLRPDLWIDKNDSYLFNYEIARVNNYDLAKETFCGIKIG